MSLRGYYQNGYVTHDLDRAMALAGQSLGLGPFTFFDVEMILSTASGDQISRVRVATAWAGAMQVELIQPVSGYVDPYLHVLPLDPDDAVPRLHHVAMRRNDPLAMRREAEGMGLPIAFESESGGIGCIFIDARARLGHFLEFVTATDAGWEMLGWPKS